MRDTGPGRAGELALALRWLAFDGRCSFSGDLLLKPILEVAGQDISHWFDPQTRDVGSVGMWGWWKRHERAGEGRRGVTRTRNSDCSETLAFKDPQAHRPTDRLLEIPHPAGPLRARPTSSAPFRLGQ